MKYKKVGYEQIKEMFNEGTYKITVIAQIPLSKKELAKLSNIDIITWEEYTLCSMLENGDFIGKRFDAIAGITYEKRLSKEKYGQTWRAYKIIELKGAKL